MSSAFDVVFEKRVAKSNRFIWWGIAVFVHVALIAAALRSEPSLESWSAEIALLVHEDLHGKAPVSVTMHEVVKPAPEPEPEPEPEAEPEAEPSPQVAPPRPVAKNAEPIGEKAPAAQAGQFAAAAATDEPLDFGDNVFVTGEVSDYVGGVTMADGKNKTAVSRDAFDKDASPTDTAGTPDRSRSVSLDPKNWTCAWPKEAQGKEIFRQTVVLRVIVSAKGNVEGARVIRDPGDGFAEAALECAKRTRFVPARDRFGKNIRAESPSIRVGFRR